MAITITDMTVCAGGNHVTLFVSEDGGPARRLPEVDIGRLSPDQTFAEIAQFMASLPAEDVEPLYRVALVIRNAPAYEFATMRAAVLAALGGQA
jgi:hypothetical protein